jgi:hypothetical protein
VCLLLHIIYSGITPKLQVILLTGLLARALLALLALGRPGAFG